MCITDIYVKALPTKGKEGFVPGFKTSLEIKWQKKKFETTAIQDTLNPSWTALDQWNLYV